jgi:hypothetical protein
MLEAMRQIEVWRRNARVVQSFRANDARLGVTGHRLRIAADVNYNPQILPTPGNLKGRL